jgi:hypothetical protein
VKQVCQSSLECALSMRSSRSFKIETPPNAAFV